jgi:predicted site-specific integrase-resolvase
MRLSLPLADAAKRLGISQKELVHMAKFGHIRAKNIGTGTAPKYYFREEAIEELELKYQNGIFVRVVEDSKND